MKFLVEPRKTAETVNGIEEPHIIISIFTPGDEPPKVCQNDYTKQVVQFAFDDLDETPGPATYAALGCPVLFDDEEAKEIVDRVRFWHQKGVNYIVCHCDAGISRSAGVAAALSKHYNGTDLRFFSDPYCPNMLVYRKVLNALHETEKAHQAHP